MSVVLNFCHARKSAHPDVVRDRTSAKGACEVIIFPGVRIERQSLIKAAQVSRETPRPRSIGGSDD